MREYRQGRKILSDLEKSKVVQRNKDHHVGIKSQLERNFCCATSLTGALRF